MPARPPAAPRGKAARTAGDGGGALRGFAGSAVGHSAGRTWWFAWTVPREGPRPWVPRRCRRALALGSVASEALTGRRHLPNRSGVDARGVAAFCQPAPSSASTQFPVASRGQAPPLRLLCPRRVARGSGLGARAKAVRRWLGDLSVAGNSGTGFPLAWRAGACAQKSGLGQGESSTQKLPDGWKLDSALKTSLGREDGCFALGSSCS